MIGRQKRAYRYSNSISHKALEHKGAYAEKEAEREIIFEYFLLSFETMAILNDYA